MLNVTTPAQYFHATRPGQPQRVWLEDTNAREKILASQVLRRQAHRPFMKPLVSGLRAFRSVTLKDRRA